MMEYAQLTVDGQYLKQITDTGNIQWDTNNYCTPAALFADGKAEQFRLVELLETVPPVFNSITQTVIRDGGELVGGQWQYKWRVDEIYPVVADKNAAVAAALAVSKTAKWEAIKDIRDLKVQSGGYKVVVSGADKWFHSDTFSRTQQMGLVMFGASCPAVPWKTMDGSYVTMSPSLAGQIFTSAAGQDQNLFGRAEALKTAVTAAANPDSVDINAGWPATYLGV